MALSQADVERLTEKALARYHQGEFDDARMETIRGRLIKEAAPDVDVNSVFPKSDFATEAKLRFEAGVRAIDWPALLTSVATGAAGGAVLGPPGSLAGGVLGGAAMLWDPFDLREGTIIEKPDQKVVDRLERAISVASRDNGFWENVMQGLIQLAPDFPSFFRGAGLAKSAVRARGAQQELTEAVANEATEIASKKASSALETAIVQGLGRYAKSREGRKAWGLNAQFVETLTTKDPAAARFAVRKFLLDGKKRQRAISAFETGGAFAASAAFRNSQPTEIFQEMILGGAVGAAGQFVRLGNHPALKHASSVAAEAAALVMGSSAIHGEDITPETVANAVATLGALRITGLATGWGATRAANEIQFRSQLNYAVSRYPELVRILEKDPQTREQFTELLSTELWTKMRKDVWPSLTKTQRQELEEIASGEMSRFERERAEADYIAERMPDRKSTKEDFDLIEGIARDIWPEAALHVPRAAQTTAAQRRVFRLIKTLRERSEREDTQHKAVLDKVWEGLKRVVPEVSDIWGLRTEDRLQGRIADLPNAIERARTVMRVMLRDLPTPAKGGGRVTVQDGVHRFQDYGDARENWRELKLHQDHPQAGMTFGEHYQQLLQKYQKLGHEPRADALQDYRSLMEREVNRLGALRDETMYFLSGEGLRIQSEYSFLQPPQLQRAIEKGAKLGLSKADIKRLQQKEQDLFTTLGDPEGRIKAMSSLFTDPKYPKYRKALEASLERGEGPDGTLPVWAVLSRAELDALAKRERIGPMEVSLSPKGILGSNWGDNMGVFQLQVPASAVLGRITRAPGHGGRILIQSEAVKSFVDRQPVPSEVASLLRLRNAEENMGKIRDYVRHITPKSKEYQALSAKMDKLSEDSLGLTRFQETFKTLKQLGQEYGAEYPWIGETLALVEGTGDLVHKAYGPQKYALTQYATNITDMLFLLTKEQRQAVSDWLEAKSQRFHFEERRDDLAAHVLSNRFQQYPEATRILLDRDYKQAKELAEEASRKIREIEARPDWKYVEGRKSWLSDYVGKGRALRKKQDFIRFHKEATPSVPLEYAALYIQNYFRAMIDPTHKSVKTMGEYKMGKHSVMQEWMPRTLFDTTTGKAHPFGYAPMHRQTLLKRYGTERATLEAKLDEFDRSVERMIQHPFLPHSRTDGTWMITVKDHMPAIKEMQNDPELRSVAPNHVIMAVSVPAATKEAAFQKMKQWAAKQPGIPKDTPKPTRGKDDPPLINGRYSVRSSEPDRTGEVQAALVMPAAKDSIIERLQSNITQMRESIAKNQEDPGIRKEFVDYLEAQQKGMENALTQIRDVLSDYTDPASFTRRFSAKDWVPGWQYEDLSRLVADYGFNIANYLARTHHKPTLDAIRSDLKSAKESVMAHGAYTRPNGWKYTPKDGAWGGAQLERVERYLERIDEHLFMPKDEWAKARAIAFTYYFWALPKQLILNLSQVPLVAQPYLAARYGDVAATAELGRSYKERGVGQWRRSKPYKDDSWFKALEWRAKSENILTESLATDLAGIAMNNWTERVRGRRSVGAALGWVLRNGTQPFALTEHYNRDITFRAAAKLEMRRQFNLAKEGGYKGSYDKFIEDVWGPAREMAGNFGRKEEVRTGNGLPQWQAVRDNIYMNARNAVQHTMYEYAQWNRPEFMRGKLLSTLFLFANYMQHTLHFLLKDPAAGRGLGLLVAAAGAQGLPFVEDIIDAYESLLQKMSPNKKVDLRADLRSSVAELFGDEWIDIVLHGLGRTGPTQVWDAIANEVGLPPTNLGSDGLGWVGDVSGSYSLGKILIGGEPAFDLMFGLIPFGTPTDFNLKDAIGAIAVEGAGPAVGGAAQIGDALLDQDNPYLWKRIEKGAPPAFRSAMRTARWLGAAQAFGMDAPAPGTEENARGTAVVAKNLGFWEAFQMAQGGVPTRVRLAQERYYTLRQQEEFYKKRQAHLFQRLDIARRTLNPEDFESVLRQIQEYNKEVAKVNPLAIITGDAIARSIKQRGMNYFMSAAGLPVTKKGLGYLPWLNTIFPTNPITGEDTTSVEEALE